jgi:magnesium chelatase subunit H
MRFVVVTLNHHLTGAFQRAGGRLAARCPGLEVELHVAADWDDDPAAEVRCREALAVADLVVVSQMFLPRHSKVILPVLREHRERYRALVCLLSEGPVTRLTRMGRFSMGGDAADGDPAGGNSWFRGLLKKLRGGGGSGAGGDSGKRQLRMLRRIPQILRFIPGPAQDVRAYFLSLQCWLSGSPENLERMMAFLVGRYGPEEMARACREVASGREAAPREYPDSGLYHPSLPHGGMTERLEDLPGFRGDGEAPTVGLLLMRSYLLAGNTAHYDAVIRALEARGLRVLPAFAAGLDNGPVVERWFRSGDGGVGVEAVVSLTGFSLVGGPAYSDTDRARELLGGLDVPYLVLQPLEFQTTEAWRDDPRGLTPLQSALNVALPELDGAVGGTVFAGRSPAEGPDLLPLPERVERAADRVAGWVRLRRKPRDERRLAVVLFNFPPNAGAVGTAAFLDVWASLHATLTRLRDEGYRVADLPADGDGLRDRVLGGNRERFGTAAHVHHRIPVDDHVAREPHLRELEAVWGPAPGKSLTDGSHLLVQGVAFGEVFVGIQPPFGWEGDPMRLLFEGGFAPTHAFSAFYRWIREDFAADAILHFGTHGAAEFMPGKHVGLGDGCWPERLLGATPLVYLYAANNPSEGTMAKRRGGAVTVTHLTPPFLRAGLYRGLLDLRGTVDRLRSLPPDADAREREEGMEAARVLAADLELLPQVTPDSGDAWVMALHGRLLELEQSLIPHGLHAVGQVQSPEARAELLEAAILHPAGGDPPEDAVAEALRPALVRIAVATGDAEARVQAARAEVADGAPENAETLLRRAAEMDDHLRGSAELDGIVRALDGRWVPPAPSGDLLRTPDLLPTGRNLTAFDPWRMPTPWALREGRRQAERILERHRADGHGLPETVGLVLWGTDNLKREGAPIAQALSLLGAEPRFDHYGRLAGARLLPLEELGRPRVDVVVAASGIFRDLLPLQMQLLAEAALLAAGAQEPPEENAVRRHALEHMEATGCSLEEAALRVFSNDDGAYGAQVNQMVDAGTWTEEEELASGFVGRKGFAFGVDGRGRASSELFRRILAGVDLTYQNLESVETGVSDLDQYFDSLGGLTRAARSARSAEAARSAQAEHSAQASTSTRAADATPPAPAAIPAYIGDETRGEGKVRTLEEQIDLEARTRLLNPRWIEGMLAHGYQGVREIEARVTNQVGWSATTGAVPEWVFRGVGETFVLDEEMRRRLAELNPQAASRVAERLLEATERGYWHPDPETLDALRDAVDELDDRLEGIETEAAA